MRRGIRLVGALLMAAPIAAGGSALRAQTMADRLAQWQPNIAEASVRFGIPEAWIRRVITAESGGYTHRGGQPIRSRVGAMGLMQLMPGTWDAMRRTHGLGTDPDDPRDNILAGTAYLRAMYDRFGWPGCFAAYNAGPGGYAAYLARRSALPAETIAYLGAVTGRGAPVAVPAGATPGQVTDPEPRQLLFALRRDLNASPELKESAAPEARGSDELFVVRRVP